MLEGSEATPILLCCLALQVLTLRSSHSDSAPGFFLSSFSFFALLTLTLPLPSFSSLVTVASASETGPAFTVPVTVSFTVPASETGELVRFNVSMSSNWDEES